MDPYSVMYLDDERNADHRTNVTTSRPGQWNGRPTPIGQRTVVVPASQRPTVIYSRQPAAQPYYGPAPQWYPPAQGSFASQLGMSMGELIDTGIQILAAIQSLPVAPVAQGDSETDVANLVTYQGALASHAKRDEQLRTLGNLLVRILK